MIIIASQDLEQAAKWGRALAPQFTIYAPVIHEKSVLKLCLKKNSVKILLLDLALLGETGVHDISSLKADNPTLHIIIMTRTPKQREEIAAILFGAKAYCDFAMDAAVLPKIIAAIMNGELWVDRKFLTRLLTEIDDIAQMKHAEAQGLDKDLAELTHREIEIANLVAIGASNQKIANKLKIAQSTVKAHLGVIYKKIGIQDRLQLALYMNRHQQLPAIWHSSSMSRDE